MAMSDSVTVSIGLEQKGNFKEMFLVILVSKLTISAAKFMKPGNIRKSSKVMPWPSLCSWEAARPSLKIRLVDWLLSPEQARVSVIFWFRRKDKKIQNREIASTKWVVKSAIICKRKQV